MSGMTIGPVPAVIITGFRRDQVSVDCYKTRREACEALIQEIDSWPHIEKNGDKDLTEIMNLCKGKLLTRARLKKKAANA